MGAAQEVVVQEFMARGATARRRSPISRRSSRCSVMTRCGSCGFPAAPPCRVARPSAPISNDSWARDLHAVRSCAHHVERPRGVHGTRRPLESRGKMIEHHLVAVFEVDGNGKIAAWREYFDPDDVNRQMRAAKTNAST